MFSMCSMTTRQQMALQSHIHAMIIMGSMTMCNWMVL